MEWGRVRASPAGSKPRESSREKGQAWHQWRREHLDPLVFPVDGYDHVYGQPVIDQVDNERLGGCMEEESPDDHDYGSTKTPDDAPVGSLRDKWRLLPYFLRLRSLLRQHIDSFDHFVETELQQIVQSPSNCEIRSDHDPRFYLRYENCWVGEPSVVEDSYSVKTITPFQCRLRDCTYSAPIYVNVRFVRGNQIVVRKNVIIGRMPIMLRSGKCLLRDKSEAELAAMKECPHDPGGYFVIKGTGGKNAVSRSRPG